LGLKDFFVHVSWPKVHIKKHIHDECEQILEKRVRGANMIVIHGGRSGKKRTRRFKGPLD